MIEEIVVPDSAKPETKSLVQDINDRLTKLDHEIAQSRATRGGYTQAPITTQPSYVDSPVLGWQDNRSDVNVIQFLDPLWQELRDNTVAIRETRVGFDSVGAENLKVNSVTARAIRAQSVTTDALRASSVTADKISVSALSAITANLGTITAGTITLDTSGFIRGGATAYNTGTGFWMGYNSGAYEFFIGNSAGNKLLWDGTNLTLTGSITATSGTIGGFNIGTDYIRDVGNSFGLASTVTGGDDVRFWAGDTFANRATAPIRIYESGSVTIAGGSVTIASTNRVLASDSSSFLTWQGPSGANTAGFYTQQSTTGGGFSAYGVGSGSPSIGLYRSAGSYGSPSNLSANSVGATLFVQGYTSGAYNEIGKHTWGIITNGDHTYYRIEVADASSANIQSWVYNYDGKLYFNPVNDAFSPNSSSYVSAPYVQDPNANLYRSGTGVIKTDGSLSAVTSLLVGSSNYNLYQSTENGLARLKTDNRFWTATYGTFAGGVYFDSAESVFFVGDGAGTLHGGTNLLVDGAIVLAGSVGSTSTALKIQNGYLVYDSPAGYVAGALTATGYITIKSIFGTIYKVLVST